MSEINFRHSHSVSLKKARTAAQKMADQLGEEFDLAHEWDGDVMRFHRTGLTGELTVSKKDVHIHIKLGLLLSFLKPRIEHEIHRYFGEDFA